MLASEFQDEITNGFLKIYLDTRLFSREGIFKCIYWYATSYIFEVELEREYFKIILRPKSGVWLSEEETLYKKIKQDLFDFQLREIITKQTTNIRDLLIAKAFANGAFDEIND